jgi:DNA-binding NarL/FixJ family response regulator
MSKSSILWQSNPRNDDVFKDIEAKARAYLSKYLDIEALMADIKAVAIGNAIISQAIAGRLAEFVRTAGGPTQNNRTSKLSIRELEVLRLVAGGAGNREVATRLYISESTVKAHLHNIMEKMQVKNRAQAVARAVSSGAIDYATLGQQAINYPAKARCVRF